MKQKQEDIGFTGYSAATLSSNSKCQVIDVGQLDSIVNFCIYRSQLLRNLVISACFHLVAGTTSRPLRVFDLLGKVLDRCGTDWRRERAWLGISWSSRRCGRGLAFAPALAARLDLDTL